MMPKFKFLLFFCITAATVHGQQTQPPMRNIGDSAPAIHVSGWLKGKPVTNFEKGKIYIVDFWATWCKPCVASLSRLSVLSHRYKDTVTVLAIDIYEMKNTTAAKIKAFVNSMGDKIDFNVAVEDTNYTVHDWLEAWDQKDYGIPRTFIIDRAGKVAWVGHPKDMGKALPKIVDDTWDIKKELAQYNFNKYLEKLDNEAAEKLSRYTEDYDKPGDMGKPDSAILVINELVKQEPKLKYAPLIASFTFCALLKTDTHQAYLYGKELMTTSTYDDPAYYAITSNIKFYEGKLKIPPQIYGLGADAYRAETDHFPYPELIDPERYRTMAKWYSLASDKADAAQANDQATHLENVNTIKSMFAGVIVK